MSIEENVDVINDQTGESMKENAEPKTASEGASTDLGKFKDVDALLRAYENLQAEFTRRSQRLRTLEKEAENFKGLVEPSGAEKLRKAAKSRREAAKKFDAFVAEVHAPLAKEKPDLLENAPDEGGKEALVDPCKEGEEARLEEAATSNLSAAQVETKVGDGGAFAKKSEALSKEEIYEQASLNEEVRLRIVGEYLASLGKSGAPLTSASAGVAITPPAKAKTVGQAGNMALLYFRKPSID